MKISPKLAAAAAGVLAVAGVGAGTAIAAAHSPAAHTAVASAEPTSPDTDNIQSGDQTTPDNTSAVATVASHNQKAAAGGENGQENNENAGEGGPSDGPGGHADASGDVQHEFDGVE